MSFIKNFPDYKPADLFSGSADEAERFLDKFNLDSSSKENVIRQIRLIKKSSANNLNKGAKILSGTSNQGEVVNFAIQTEENKIHLLRIKEDLYVNDFFEANVYKSIVEKQHELVCRFLPDTTLIYINEAYAKEFGAQKSDLIGKKFIHFLPVEDHELLFDHLKKVGASDTIVYSFHKVIKDGAERWHEWADYVVERDFEGNPSIFQSVGRHRKSDVSDELRLKAANEKLQKTNQDLESLLKNRSFYVIKTDIEGRYTYMNEVFKTKFEGTAPMLGTSSMNSIIQEDWELCIQTVQQCIENVGKPFEVMLRKPYKDGYIHNKWEFKCLADDSGNPREILCVGFDVSTEVESLNRLKEVVDLLNDQNERLKEFAQIVSHNIRSHSSNIMGLIEILIHGKIKDSFKEESLLALKDSSNKLDETIRDLNTILHMSDKRRLKPQLVNLSDVVRSVIEEFGPIIEQKNAVVNFSIDGNLQIETVKSYLKSIVYQLIHNSLQFQDKNKKQLLINISSKNASDAVYLIIEDNGIGIDINNQKNKIFEMYRTFHSTGSRSKGFGLFLVKNQVSFLGGDIDVESKLGYGSKFTVMLPLQA
ncbi:MAG: PAS domain-containing sensor histidine kinase [Balneolales bacterium]|nr:PAS domain-containing sensor histidine kinase [Balneolales bacterium]